MISREYVVNSYKDYDKISDFAYELADKLRLNPYGYRGWEIGRNMFFICTWSSECGCSDNYGFPIEWLDLPFDRIVDKWYEEKCKNPKDREIVVGEC